MMLTQLFTRLGLQHPAEWRAKRQAHNLAEGLDPMAGTGRTTVALVEALAMAMRKQPVVFVVADAVERERIADVLVNWIEALDEGDTLEAPDILVLTRAGFTEKVRSDSATMLKRHMVYDHFQPWGV